MFERFATIFTTVIMPVLAMTGIGAAVQRYRPMHVDTLVRLNLYVFSPAFLFVKVAESTLSWREIGALGVAIMAPMAVVGAVLFLALRTVRAEGKTTAVVLLAGLFYNAGNFGIPVAELAYPGQGGSVQALIVMYMNTTIFFLGYLILSLALGRGAAGVMGYFKLPLIYAIIAALVVRDTGTQVPQWVMSAMRAVSDGMVPIALVTLGAQLAENIRWPRWRVVVPVVVVKLAVMPAATAAAVWALGMNPAAMPGAVIVLAASSPAAVNTLLLTLELEGDADTAAECVVWTTLLSAVTVTVVLFLLQR